MTIRHLRVLGDTTGSAAAEMALLVPLMIVLMFVCFEGGYFLWNEHKVVKGVRDGARYAGRLSFGDYDCSAGTIDGTAAARIRNLTRTGQIADGGTPVVAGWTDGDVVVSLACQARDGMYDANSGEAPVVKVKAQVPYPASPLTALAGALGFSVGTIDLNAEAQSSVMGL